MLINCCSDQKLVKNGKSKGVQNYICKSCNRQMKNSDKPPHRPSLGGKALSGAERQRKWREKQRKLLDKTLNLAKTIDK